MKKSSHKETVPEAQQTVISQNNNHLYKILNLEKILALWAKHATQQTTVKHIDYNALKAMNLC